MSHVYHATIRKANHNPNLSKGEHGKIGGLLFHYFVTGKKMFKSLIFTLHLWLKVIIMHHAAMVAVFDMVTDMVIREFSRKHGKRIFHYSKRCLIYSKVVNETTSDFVCDLTTTFVVRFGH